MRASTSGFARPVRPRPFFLLFCRLTPNTDHNVKGTLAGAFMLYSIAQDSDHRSDFTHWYSTYMALFVALLSYINGLYYMQQVTVSTARKDESFVS